MRTAASRGRLRKRCSSWSQDRDSVHALRCGTCHISLGAPPQCLLQCLLCTSPAVAVSCLHAVQEVITSKEADQSPRWLAAVQLKNSVIKHWRPQSGGK